MSQTSTPSFRLVATMEGPQSTDEQIEHVAELLKGAGATRNDIRVEIEKLNTVNLLSSHAWKLDFLARKVDGYIDREAGGIVWFD